MSIQVKCFIVLIVVSLATGYAIAIMGCLASDEKIEAALPSCELVFVGEVTHTECPELGPEIDRTKRMVDGMLATIRPLEVWRGDLAGPVVVESDRSCSLRLQCDDTRLDLLPGQRVLAFVKAKPPSGPLVLVGYRFPEETSVADWDRWRALARKAG